jgi:hypothetical protein
MEILFQTDSKPKLTRAEFFAVLAAIRRSME